MNHRLLLTAVALMAAPVLVRAQATAASTAAAAAKPAQDTVRGLPIDGIAAIVGDQIILVSEVMTAVNQARASGAKVESAADLAKLEADILERLIDAELLVQKAKDEKVEVQDGDVASSVDDQEKNIRKRFQSDAEFKAALKEAGMGTIEEWRKITGDQLRRDKMQQQVMQKLQRDGKVSAVNVSEEEIREAFEVFKQRIGRKEARVGLRQIVVATKPSEAAKKRARDKIDSLWNELQKRPEDFELMAKKYSMDGSAELGGDLGWNRRGRMVPEFDRMMFSLNPGVISPIVETAFGFHIIRVDRVQPAEVKARHILIRPQVDSSDERRAKELADSIVVAWRAGGSFDSLSVKFHDNASGEDKTIPEYPRSELPEPYRNALEGATLNQIVDPFPLPDPSAGVAKFVIAQVTFLDEAGEWTLNEARDRIRDQLSEERKMRRLIDNLKKQTYVSVRYDPTKQGGGDR
ncbi:peptidylprolyl isomerase [Gemmatimonas sp.]|jgi:peptidyl-prolyl cis-trans isomerase SurA|uniref:peptidylprolyl isomerase n=1 Tax=Gemmatimonas sp. TaxID=1962908 RepID=UPI0022CB0EDB|nr:peptidylprolyl isomerase [Gemmatimonas sp.]MCZ8203539.1 peptidylprolyl isomerase [Gemmatimonas sp.]